MPRWLGDGSSTDLIGSHCVLIAFGHVHKGPPQGLFVWSLGIHTQTFLPQTYSNTCLTPLYKI